MKFNFFKDVTTVEELKKQYKALAFKHHPDKGGRVEDMQQINNEYDELYKRVKNIHETADGKKYTKEQRSDVPDMFKEIINAIIGFNVKIELCGSWLWVFGAYAYKDQLKELGFFWCSGKKAWAWSQDPKNSKFHLTIEQIRRLHGSEVIKEQEEQNKLTGAA